MRILLLGKPYFADELRELGHEVEVCGHRDRGRVNIKFFPMEIEDVLGQLSPSFEPDAILLGDQSMHPLFVGLERLDIPVGWIAIDSHIHMRWHQHYAAGFDVIDVAQESYVAGYRFDDSRQAVGWAPLFVRQELLEQRELTRDLDVSFVGSLNKAINPARVELIEGLLPRVPLHVASGDFVDIFHRSKMILNQCLNDDVNFRTFEAMACGGMLLMERVGNGFAELFEDGKHCVCYERGDVDGLVSLIEYYLSHPEECAKIAATGREEVLSRHTALHRAQRWVDALGDEKIGERVQGRLAKSAEIHEALARVYTVAAQAYEKAGIERMHHAYTSLIEKLA